MCQDLQICNWKIRVHSARYFKVKFVAHNLELLLSRSVCYFSHTIHVRETLQLPVQIIKHLLQLNVERNVAVEFTCLHTIIIIIIILPRTTTVC
jgi:hypothetical protein